MSASESGTDHGRRSRGIGCLIGGLVAFAGLGLLGLGLASMAGGLAPVEDISEVTESAEPSATRKLVLIDLSGVIMGSETSSLRSSPATTVHKMLKRAAKDPQVAGILLKLDTPGGGVTASDILHDAVRKIRRDGKKVVALMGDLCASGGVYVAVAADRIWAYPTTLTGSIGVLLGSYSLKELMERHGIVDQSIVSGKNKQILSMTRELTDEQRVLLNEIVGELYGRFVSLVAEGRKQAEDVVRTYADGRLLTANQAKAVGLIDKIGYHEDALDDLKAMAGGGPFNVVRYTQQEHFLDKLAVHISGGRRGGAVVERVIDSLIAGPRAYYLYGAVESTR